MPTAQEQLAEFEVQAPLTRKFLERLPEDQLLWKPHGKSMTAGQLDERLFHVICVDLGLDLRGVPDKGLLQRFCNDDAGIERQSNPRNGRNNDHRTCR
jgi:hypothetical protein